MWEKAVVYKGVKYTVDQFLDNVGLSKYSWVSSMLRGL